MGPYCRYCGGRCFVLASVTLGCVDGARPLLWDLVAAISARPPELMATCGKGKSHDRRILGICHDDLLLLRDAYERGVKAGEPQADGKGGA